MQFGFISKVLSATRSGLAAKKKPRPVPRLVSRKYLLWAPQSASSSNPVCTLECDSFATSLRSRYILSTAHAGGWLDCGFDKHLTSLGKPFTSTRRNGE